MIKYIVALTSLALGIIGAGVVSVAFFLRGAHSEALETKLRDTKSDLEKMTNISRMLREELNATQAQRDELERRIAYALL